MTTTSSDAVKTGRRRFWCPAATTYVQHGKDILWVGMGAELNRMSPGGWAPGVTHSEEPWPTSRTNLHKLLFSLDSHVNTQVSEVCACCFWTMTPAITVSFKNILELVKPRKTYQGNHKFKHMCPCLTSAPSKDVASVDGISSDSLVLEIAKKRNHSLQQVQTQHV